MYGVAEEGQWPTFPGLSDTEALLLKMARLTAEVGGVSIDCDGHFSLTCEALAEGVSAILENFRGGDEVGDIRDGMRQAHID